MFQSPPQEHLEEVKLRDKCIYGDLGSVLSRSSTCIVGLSVYPILGSAAWVKPGNLGFFGHGFVPAARMCPGLSSRTRGWLRDSPLQGILGCVSGRAGGTTRSPGCCHLPAQTGFVTEGSIPAPSPRLLLRIPGWSLWLPPPSWPCWCWPWDTPTPRWTGTGSSGKNPTARNIIPRWEWDRGAAGNVLGGSPGR